MLLLYGVYGKSLLYPVSFVIRYKLRNKLMHHLPATVNILSCWWHLRWSQSFRSYSLNSPLQWIEINDCTVYAYDRQPIAYSHFTCIYTMCRQNEWISKKRPCTACPMTKLKHWTTVSSDTYCGLKLFSIQGRHLGAKHDLIYIKMGYRHKQKQTKNAEHPGENNNFCLFP